MSIRTVTYLLDGENNSPESPQYGGVRYEDNATNVVFVLDENYKQNIENAYPDTKLVYRIDFNSLNAGYNPSENLMLTDNTVSRPIPLCMTFYGEQISASLVITAIDNSGNAVGTVVSPEMKIYFDNISKDEIADNLIVENISAVEDKIKEFYLTAEKQAELAEGFADIAADNAAFLQAAADSAAESAAVAEENAKISEAAAVKCSQVNSIITECETATENANSSAEELEKIKQAIDDSGFFRSIEEINKGLVMRFWVGTRTEYDALTEKPQDCYVIITDDNTMTDFIVEQGEIDGWTYRKWNSGITECWAYVEYENVNFNVSKNGAYCIDSEYLTSTLPIAFINGARETSIQGNANNLYIVGSSWIEDNILCFDVYSLQQLQNQKIDVRWYVVGRWK